MGKLRYGTISYDLDDRLLAHLQIVVSTKLRRGENFFVSWRNPAAAGSGRQALWIDNGVPLAFEYAGGSFPSVSREWVETLANSAATGMGLQLTDETGQLLNAPRHFDVIE